MLRNIGVNWRERRLIRNVYMEQRVKLRINQGETDSVKIGSGVRQGCCMSPILFNLYGEYLMKDCSFSSEVAIKHANHRDSHVQYFQSTRYRKCITKM